MSTRECTTPLILQEGYLPYASVQDLARILQRCAKQKCSSHALSLVAHLVKTGLETHQLLVGYLVPVLVNVGHIVEAHHIFDRLFGRSALSWQSLYAGHDITGQASALLENFVPPDRHSFMAALKVSTQLKDVESGRKIHAIALREGLLQKDPVVGNVVVDMYCKCGSLGKAKQVFDRLPDKDIVTWTALLGGYADRGLGEEALECFQEMQLQGISPNAITLVCGLKASMTIRAIVKGQEIHAEIERKGLLETDLFLGSALIDMYAKYGLLAHARQVFDKLPVRNVVCWNALIVGYTNHDSAEKAVECFEQMHKEDVFPTETSLSCGLKAYGSIGATGKIAELHVEIERRGLVKKDHLIGSTLITVYATCGSLLKAQQVFDVLPFQDVVSWTALLAGYAQLGESKIVTGFFDKMLGHGVQPDPMSFVVILNACSRAGLFDKSQMYFLAMSKEHGVVPILEHHSCLVDLLGRVGELDIAIGMIKRMPLSPNPIVWRALLGACRNLGNNELGNQAFKHAICL